MDVAAKAGMSSTTLAVAWTLTRDFVGSTIVGATTIAQVPDLLKGAEVQLPADVVTACEQVTREILYPMG